MKKKFITFTLAGALMASALGSFAGSREPLIKVERVGLQGIHLHMDELEETAQLTIFDAYKAKLFQSTTEKLNDINKRFDLSQLPDGKYSLEVEYGNKVKVYSFMMANRNVEVSQACATVFKPTINQSDSNILDVSILNLNKKDVSIELVNNAGESLVDQTITNEQVVAKRYNLSRLPHGNYQVIIRTSERVFIDSVNL